MATTSAQYVSCRDRLPLTAAFEHNARGGRIGIDRYHFSAKLDLNTKTAQVVAQDCLGAPLRQAALILVGRAGISELLARDLPQAGTQKLDLSDAHARAKERIGQAGALEHFQCCGLQGGPARLAMRPQSPFHNAWPDTMTNQFASREQSGRPGPDHEGFRI
jgi:hypothetical protein